MDLFREKYTLQSVCHLRKAREAEEDIFILIFTGKETDLKKWFFLKKTVIIGNIYVVLTMHETLF